MSLVYSRVLSFIAVYYIPYNGVFVLSHRVLSRVNVLLQMVTTCQRKAGVSARILFDPTAEDKETR